MIRIGIVGCGKMAEQHVMQIRRIPDTEIAAVCDTEPLMARQLAERYGINYHCKDVNEMLQQAKPDIIHITTPPHSHYNLGRLCLAAGSHVYMEKPFTLNTAEAEDLIQLAKQSDRKITAGHNAQFTHTMIRMRELVKGGYLGGNPLHMECHYCYDFSNTSYAKALLGDHDHWVRKLPGALLQNIISHGISRIAEFLVGEHPMVIASGFTSEFLKNIGESEIVDELRVIIKDEASTTAYFTFSSQIRPAPRQFKLYGPKRSVFIDEDHQILIKSETTEYKSYLSYFIPPLGFAIQHIANSTHNVSKFIKKDFHLPNDAGLKALIEGFYNAALHDDPLPISYQEILRTSRIMDDIFAQIKIEQYPG